MPSNQVISSKAALGWFKAPHVQAWVFVAVVCGAMFGLTAWRAVRAHDVAIEQARVTTANLARSLADHAHATIQVADNVVDGIAERLRLDGISPATLAHLHNRMVARVANVPSIHQLGVFSAEGDALTASFDPLPPVNIADRAYFAYHRDHQDRARFIGPLVQNRADGHWSFTVSRRINQADGSFGGVAVGVIDCDTFASFYRSFDTGRHGLMLLRNVDQTVLVREPPIDGAVGVQQASVDFLDESESLSGRYVSRLDHIERIYQARLVGEYPLVVVAAVSVDDVLGGWRRDTWTAFLATLIVSAALALLGWRLVHQMRLRERREIAIRRSEEQHRLLADNTSDAITCLDMDLKRTYVSAGFQRMFGYQNEEVVNTSVLGIMHPDDASRVRAQLLRLVSGDADQQINTARLIHKQGHSIWVEASLSLIRDQVTAEPSSIICVIRDVTARKRAEFVAAEANRWLALAEHVACVGHWRFEPATGRLHWSAEVYRIHGLDPDSPQPTMTQAIEGYHPEDRHVVRDAIDRAVAEHAGYEIVLRLVRADGTIRHVQMRAVVEPGADGEVAALFGVLLDITVQFNDQAAKHYREECERLTLEAAHCELKCLADHLTLARDEAERTSRAKSRFLAGMSHELRTPLNGILGYAHLLKLEGGLTPKQSLRVGAMLGAGQHLQEMISRVLDLSEIEAERMELRPIIIDLRKAMAACLDFVRPAAEAKQLALSLHAAPDLPRHCLLDPTLLQQMVLNLLGNAVKFTTRGGVQLHLRSAARGSKLRIEVIDSGPGIPAARHSQLFQEFERLGIEEVTLIEGAGLGLALSARLAALMEGSIGFVDNPAGGSIFWLELPLVTGDTALHALSAAISSSLPSVQHQDTAAPVVGPLRVLVVDDVGMNRDIAGSFLQAGGYKTQCVESGAAAIAAASANDFAAILMDVRMPGMDGLEATRHIRALAGPRGRVPIIALTAQAFAEQVRECREAGMDGHLAKPFTPDALLSTIAKAVEGGCARGPLEALSQPAASSHQANADPAIDPAIVETENVAPENGAPEVVGSELQVFDVAAFEETAAFVAPNIMAGYLQTVAERSEALQLLLRAPSDAMADLADAAHTLAGSAGMFGFDRLAGLARRFEHVARAGDPDTARMAAGLDAAIEASLHELQARRHVIQGVDQRRELA